MRQNAIARIIIYSILILVLTGILLTCIASEFFMFHFGDHSATDVPTEGFAPGTIRRLEIEWASGSVTIQKGTDDKIWFYETAPDGCWYNMEYDYDEDSLSISYSKNSISIGFGDNSIPRKDLVIQVPQDWDCEELDIDGAALDINVQELRIETLELDGASCQINFHGEIDHVKVDGASADLNLNCMNRPATIDIDGASCELDLILPKDCGFQVSIDGLSCDLNTDLPYTIRGDYKVYGDGQCKIDVDGLSCDVTIRESE